MKKNKNEEVATYEALDEKAVSMNETYILKMRGSSTDKVGIVMSDSTCEVYTFDESSLRKHNKLSDKVPKICDVRFSPQNDSILYIGSGDGSIKVWDLRSGSSCSSIFEEDPKSREFVKPLISFDVSCNDRVLCGGSELTDNDAFMLFWDIRSKSLLGGYWNSHTDDIVQVMFSPNHVNKLITGGVDGLVNVFDISETNEDDALQYSLSTDCAVDKVSWLSEEVISCVTQNIDVQIWNVESADQLHNFTRKNIAATMSDTREEDCYVVDVYSSSDDKPLFITGSYFDEARDLKMIECADGDLALKKVFTGNKQIVRCSWYDSEREFLVTGGEMGVLTSWKNSSTQIGLKSDSSIIRGIKKMNVHKKKPY